MEYVMVPVPEELVEDVDHFLRWSLTDRPNVWDTEAASAYVAGLDDVARRFLLCVVDAEQDGRLLTIQIAAEAVGCRDREILGLVVELNETVRAAGGPVFFMAPENREGARGIEGWTVNIPGDIARLVLESVGRPPARPELTYPEHESS